MLTLETEEFSHFENRPDRIRFIAHLLKHASCVIKEQVRTLIVVHSHRKNTQMKGAECDARCKIQIAKISQALFEIARGAFIVAKCSSLDAEICEQAGD